MVWLRICCWVSDRKHFLPDTKCWLRNPECGWTILSQSYINFAVNPFTRRRRIASNNFCQTNRTAIQRNTCIDHGSWPAGFHWLVVSVWPSHHFRYPGFDRHVISDTVTRKYAYLLLLVILQALVVASEDNQGVIWRTWLNSHVVSSSLVGSGGTTRQFDYWYFLYYILF